MLLLGSTSVARGIANCSRSTRRTTPMLRGRGSSYRRLLRWAGSCGCSSKAYGLRRWLLWGSNRGSACVNRSRFWCGNNWRCLILLLKFCWVDRAKFNGSFGSRGTCDTSWKFYASCCRRRSGSGGSRLLLGCAISRSSSRRRSSGDVSPTAFRRSWKFLE